MILAIDTTTQFAGLALYEPDGMPAEEIWDARRNHTVEIFPRLERMLAQNKLTVPDLDGIVVAVGPGSYTGVRVGVAIAKGLALPHNLPTAGVATLDVTAYPHRRSRIPVIALAQAGRKRFLAAWFGYKNKRWTQLLPTALFTLPELAANISRKVWVTGELNAEQARMLQESSNGLVTIAPTAERVRRPGVLAELGYPHLQASTDGNFSHLAPVYLKDP